MSATTKLASAVWRKIKLYPSRTAGVIGSGLSLGIGYGLHMTPVQFGLTMAFVYSVLSWLVERNVSPTVKLPELADEESGRHEDLASDAP